MDDVERIRNTLFKRFPNADNVRVVEHISGSVNAYFWAVVDFFGDAPVNIAVRKNHLDELMFFEETIC